MLDFIIGKLIVLNVQVISVGLKSLGLPCDEMVFLFYLDNGGDMSLI